MNDLVQVFAYAAFAAVLVLSLVRHIRATRRKEERGRAAAEKGKLSSGGGPRAQHPHIDVTCCIGCGACVDACPEGDVLAVVAGKAAIANGDKCIGHGLCAEACPVGAIEIVMASPSIAADMPALTAQYESTVPGLFIIGELGGLALIKNAVHQGTAVIDVITARLTAARARAAAGAAQAGTASAPYDVCIVGAGPAGISASLRAIEHKLSYVTLEQDEFGGTVAKFPRQKLVMTSPVQFPLYGKFRKLEVSKEELLAFWRKVSQRAEMRVRTNEKVESVVRGADGLFTVTSAQHVYRARTVVLALGRRGTPRKLGIPGEEMPKVMYGLIETEAYTQSRILVVGGGDSAVEAAMGLAAQKGNRVSLSYRRDAFSRLKERNAKRLEECLRKGTVEVIFSSNPVEVRPKSVVLDVKGTRREIANDWMWVFAGGTPPAELLAKAGITLGKKDLTEEARQEARRAGKAA